MELVLVIYLSTVCNSTDGITVIPSVVILRDNLQSLMDKLAVVCIENDTGEQTMFVDVSLI